MANGYIKIASGSGFGSLRSAGSSLWRGPDHLLLVEKDGYSENYRRFYFADIQSFTIRRDRRQRTLLIAFGAAVAACFLAALAFGGAAGVFFEIMGGALVLPLIYVLLRGPTCVAHLATAVQREELLSLQRLRTAEEVLRQVIEAARMTQGILTADLARVQFEVHNAPPATAPPRIPAAQPPPVPPPLE